MKLLSLICIPFFPYSKELKVNWWHRLAIVTATLVSFMGYLIFFSIWSYFFYEGYLNFQVSQASLIVRDKIRVVVPNDNSDGFVPERGKPISDFVRFDVDEMGNSIKAEYSGSDLSKYSDEVVGQALLKTRPDLKDNAYYYSEYRWRYELILISFVLLLFSLFIVNIPYRILLYIAKGSSWTDKK